jgi:hypothetical protein
MRCYFTETLECVILALDTLCRKLPIKPEVKKHAVKSWVQGAVSRCLFELWEKHLLQF